MGLVDCLFDSLHPSHHFFSLVGTELPGLNQYHAEDKVSPARTQHGSNPQHLDQESSTLPLSHHASDMGHEKTSLQCFKPS